MANRALPSVTRWGLLLIRIILGAIFVYAAADKIIHPEAFARIIHNYRLVPPYLVNALAIFLPWIELVAGIGLIVGFKYRGANVLILAMLVVFTGALTISYARGINLNCGCFSTAPNVKSNLLVRILEDVIMMSGSVLILFRSRPGKLGTGP